jgi:MYXO-CTERM domain-containing protein
VVDLQLAAGSAAVDKGVVLTAINDGFTGAAPDLGAYEVGAAPPVYGPRTGGSSGTIGAGGATGAGGVAGSGGLPGTGGALATGGVTGSGGLPGTGGALATGGLPDTGDTSPGTGSGAGKSGGCGCSTAPAAGSRKIALLVLAMLAAWRRRPRRSSNGR